MTSFHLIHRRIRPRTDIFPSVAILVVNESVDRYKVRGVKLCWFFKEALRGFLPDEIITKKKHDFGLPFGVWTVRHARLDKLPGDSLYRLAVRGVMRVDAIDKLQSVHPPAHPGYYGEMVWILMMLEQWLRVKVPNWRLA
jgi:asparagine synthase (glutamine-hydrolysing)